MCGETSVIIYLSLVDGVVTYMHNWSRVSLGGPYEGHTKGDTDDVFSLHAVMQRSGIKNKAMDIVLSYIHIT